MRSAVWTLAVLSLSAVARPAVAGDHLVPGRLVQERLQAAEAQRQSDLAALDAALDGPRARAAAERVGVDLESARSAVATLDERELRDLAGRARALQSDPAAGFDRDIRDLLMLFLIVAIVILVLQAVD